MNQRVSEKNLVSGSREIPVECYTRVVGYFQPVRNWNKGKQSEYEQRKEYDVNKKVKELFT